MFVGLVLRLDDFVVVVQLELPLTVRMFLANIVDNCFVKTLVVVANPPEVDFGIDGMAEAYNSGMVVEMASCFRQKSRKLDCLAGRRLFLFAHPRLSRLRRILHSIS